MSSLPDLIHVSDDRPGWTRKKWGRGFRYFKEDGAPITDRLVRNRIKALAIPPAWTNVWICPLENGHLLSTGRDEAGRKQYRYHPDWMAYQQLNKFANLVRFAALLPAARELIRDLIQNRSQGWTRRRVAAVAIAMMDETGMRVGNASYRRRNGTIGLTTLRRKHVEADDDGLHFEYTGKSGQERHVDLEDENLVRVVQNMSELPGYEIFRYRGESGKMQNLESGDINELVHELIGPDFSSKYFRTWAGTTAAVAKYWEIRQEPKQPKQMDVEVIKRTAEVLGNTVAVCRKYYVHPTVLVAIRELRVPGPESVTEAHHASFGGEFDAEEVIAFRLADGENVKLANG